MEKLSALDLFILLIDMDYCVEQPQLDRMKHVNAWLQKRIKDELLARDFRELEAALSDLKRISPDLTPGADFVQECINFCRKLRTLKNQ